MTNTETNTIEAEFEIVPRELLLSPEQKAPLEIAFTGFFAEARKWREQAEGITEPKLARAARLELKNIRVSAEKTRKDLKEDSLRMGKAIDGANNILLALIVPIEKKLEDIEKEADRKEAQRIADLSAVREAELASYSFPSNGMTLGTMTEENWSNLLQTAKDAAAAKAERECLEKQEAEAKAKAEAEERVRIAAENERLKKEAAEREAQRQKELEAERAERARIEAEAKAQREADALKAAEERRVLEEKAAAERKETERKHAEECAASEKARAEAEAKAKAEREAAEIETRKAHEAARVEREAREQAEKDACVLREAEAKRFTDEESAKKKAARAPDKEKIAALAGQVRAIQIPTVKTDEAKSVISQIEEQFAKFAQWLETQAAKL